MDGPKDPKSSISNHCIHVLFWSLGSFQFLLSNANIVTHLLTCRAHHLKFVRLGWPQSLVLQQYHICSTTICSTISTHLPFEDNIKKRSELSDKWRPLDISFFVGAVTIFAIIRAHLIFQLDMYYVLCLYHLFTFSSPLVSEDKALLSSSLTIHRSWDH